jgi:hypothetical protein
VINKFTEFKDTRKEWPARKKVEVTKTPAQDNSLSFGSYPHASFADSPYATNGMDTLQGLLLDTATHQQPDVPMPRYGVQFGETDTFTTQVQSLVQYSPQPLYAGYAAPSQYFEHELPFYSSGSFTNGTQNNGNTDATTNGDGSIPGPQKAL